jgi:bifunctional non-homologous end joining protein LigD
MERNPQLYTDNMRIQARKGKIFIDYLRNGWASTAAVAYGIRNRPGTPVALPVNWKDLNARLKPDAFTVENTRRLLKRRKDPWAGYFKNRQHIEVLK